MELTVQAKKMENRRKYTRLQVAVEVRARERMGKSAVTGSIRDISPSGMRIEVPGSFKQENVYFFDFMMPNGLYFKHLEGKILIELAGPNSNQYGVEFVKLNNLTKWKLINSVWWSRFNGMAGETKTQPLGGLDKSDYRRDPRVFADLQAELTTPQTGKVKVTGQVLDISAGGFRLKTEKLLSLPETFVEANFNTQNSLNQLEKVMIKCRVVWQSVQEKSFVYGLQYAYLA